MGVALSPRRAVIEPIETPRLQFILRFAAATTGAFVLSEWMGWQPSMLGPVLTGVLLASLPNSPPLKAGLALIVIMALSAWFAFLLTTLLGPTPHILFGAIGLVLFLAFAALARGKGQLPITLLLICMGVVPVATLSAPQFADQLPGILIRAMAIAVVFTWVAYAIWPRPFAKPPAPASVPSETPIAVAIAGTAIVLPLMLVFLLFGLTDAIPVLLTTILLVANIEEERGAANARAMLTSNFLGGVVAIGAYHLLQVAPSLATLALITFLIGLCFAGQIAKGGSQGSNYLLGYNASMVIFGLALMKGPANSGTWGARVVQFAIACIFAVSMMRLLMPIAKARLGRARPA